MSHIFSGTDELYAIAVAGKMEYCVARKNAETMRHRKDRMKGVGNSMVDLLRASEQMKMKREGCQYTRLRGNKSLPFYCIIWRNASVKRCNWECSS